MTFSWFSPSLGATFTNNLLNKYDIHEIIPFEFGLFSCCCCCLSICREGETVGWRDREEREWKRERKINFDEMTL